MLKAIIIVLAIFSTQINANDDVEFNGIDLNPGLLRCVMAGGACLSTIPVIGLFFGGGKDAPYHTDESMCYGFLDNWCKGPAGYSAHDQCRESKKRLYKAMKTKLGQWPTKEQFNDKYGGRWKPLSNEETYFAEIEEDDQRQRRYGEPIKAPYFTCTPKQEFLWLKNRCGHTTEYRNSRNWQSTRDQHPDVWARMKTNDCKPY